MRRLLLSCSLMIMALGCSKAPEEAAGGAPEAEGPPADPPSLVKVQTIEKKSVAPEFLAMGNVRPRHFSIVASGSDGVVEEYPLEVGAFVKAGTLLSKLRMESTDLELAEQEALVAAREAELAELQSPRKEDVDEAKARLQAMEVTYSTAERRLEELRALSKRGAANNSEVKDAEDAIDAARQDLVAAKAVYQRVASGAREEQKQQAKARLDAQKKHVEFLKAEREKRMTRAPFDGYIVEEHTYLGQWLSKGAPVVTLARLDEVEVEVLIDQQFIDQIRPGRAVSLKVEGTGQKDGKLREWPGEVATIVPRSNWESGSRSFPVIIRIQNEFDSETGAPIPALREGMMAEATFNGSPVDGIMVPKDSIVRTSRGAFIFVVNPQEADKPLSVRQVMVEVGISNGTWIQVRGETLEAGQQVVTEGAERLRAFKTIEIIKTDKTDTAG
ncbi:MAG: efflux RND transporter periplasmic adaptor subunit [Planctomycetaceae bacterium]|nr:efflux RND transporter periplasmic adaptor subunit [Planctomycetaceae bacterium]